MLFRNIKGKIWKGITISFLVGIGIHLIGGGLYNIIFKNKIDNDIYLLKQELQSNPAFEKYKQKDVYTAKTRAIISKTLVMFFRTDEVPTTTLLSIQNQLIEGNWTILKKSDNLHELTAQKSPYILIVSLDNSRPKYTWSVFIKYDDFLSKYNF